MALDTKTYSLPIARTVGDLRTAIRPWRSQGDTVALVPTMGALHAGHLSLVDEVKKRGARTGVKTIVSIFVNPTQFGPGEDLNAYPRTEATDAEKLSNKADLIFAPNAAEIYPADFSTAITVGGVTQDLEGAFRPTHFSGVATIVAKLLLAALPDIAIFGEKDYQQLLTIRRMVRDLNIPVEIAGSPIIREKDGLALSSRNSYLSAADRAIAGQLNVVLKETAQAVAKGAAIADATAKGRARLQQIGFASVDYLDIRHAETLASFPSGRPDAPARLLVAATIGKTRLIDNMPVG